MTFTENDIRQLTAKGITPEKLEQQLNDFKTGFPYLKLKAPASIGGGIVAPTESEREHYVNVWNDYKAKGHKIVKFVPASGAASRMFKDMFAFVDAAYDVPTTDFEKKFFENIDGFAFFELLDSYLKAETGKGVHQLIEDGEYKTVANGMLKGLNYGNLPKGMLLFHNYDEGARTPMEEHLVEGAMYAASNGKSNVHFTVSHEHLDLFKNKVKDKLEGYSKRFGVEYNVTFSEQKPSTDTVAANPDGTVFRNDDGTMLFRPGGHGALIENLNEIDADVIFVKNIDNVVPDRLKSETVEWKQVIAGILISLQKQAFEYLKVLESGQYNREILDEMGNFVQDKLYCVKDDLSAMSDDEMAEYLTCKLNRPMRVAGVVKNVGEPGGGPFLAYNQDGTYSLQILESSQIDKSNELYVKYFTEGTHFNPVDLVCAVRNYKGEPFDLPKYVDPSTGFISQKSKNGKELQALELPGLWNGAMSDWNTIFVEVPLGTFNPVKTVNDLLREQHQ